MATNAGKSRVAKTTNKRISKGEIRNDRIQQLVHINSQAAKLYQTGTVPMQEYDINITGWSEAQMTRLRKGAVKVQKRVGNGQCTTTTLRWKQGKEIDPIWRLPKEQIKLWCQMWAQIIKEGNSEYIAELKEPGTWNGQR